MTREMKRILDASATERMTIKMLLVDCSDEEIARTLIKYNGVAGFHQKLVLMRAELARRYPDKKDNHRTNMPIELRIDWEVTCKPFRIASKKKRERERREAIQKAKEEAARRLEAVGGCPKESIG